MRPAPLPLFKTSSILLLTCAAMQTLCEGRVYPLKTSNANNEKQTYIYFLGETILRIRNNCRENSSQFWWVGGEGRQHTLKRDCCDPWPPQQRPQGGGGGGEEDDMNEKQTGFSI